MSINKSFKGECNDFRAITFYLSIFTFYHASSHSTVLLRPHGHLKAFLFHFNPSKFQSFREFFLFFIYGELEMDVYATDTNGWCELGAS